jgi:hypothetical protein
MVEVACRSRTVQLRAAQPRGLLHARHYVQVQDLIFITDSVCLIYELVLLSNKCDIAFPEFSRSSAVMVANIPCTSTRQVSRPHPVPGQRDPPEEHRHVCRADIHRRRGRGRKQQVMAASGWCHWCSRSRGGGGGLHDVIE